MLIALLANNKVGFVDGSLVKLDGSYVNLLNSWIHNNNVVSFWILNSISKDISASVIFSNSTVDIWNDLKDRFQRSNGPRLLELRRSLLNLSQEQNSVYILLNSKLYGKS